MSYRFGARIYGYLKFWRRWELEAWLTPRNMLLPFQRSKEKPKTVTKKSEF